MDEKSLYAHILNLSAPWQVESLSLDENAGYVTVVVGIAKNTLLICPTCGQQCPVHDHRHRKWRHLDTCQFMTVVEASVPGSCVQTMDARRYLFHGPELVAGIRYCSNHSSLPG